mmetsp:Transcript_66831/g.193539  ORF Transcript_66831/g.193539 Transcript_66831/m.193539 type:complete len:268 (+) Transcript_66831:1-804(+)
MHEGAYWLAGTVDMPGIEENDTESDMPIAGLKVSRGFVIPRAGEAGKAMCGGVASTVDEGETAEFLYLCMRRMETDEMSFYIYDQAGMDGHMFEAADQTSMTTVAGSMSLTVSDPAAFIADPEVKPAITSTIAKLVGVPTSAVEVTLSAGRRLEAWSLPLPRRLAGTVRVTYIILVPDESMGETVRMTLTATTPTEMTTLMTTEMEAAGVDVVGYTLIVDSLEAPQVTAGGTTGRTPSDAVAEQPATTMAMALALAAAVAAASPLRV